MQRVPESISAHSKADVARLEVAEVPRGDNWLWSLQVTVRVVVRTVVSGTARRVDGLAASSDSLLPLLRDVVSTARPRHADLARLRACIGIGVDIAVIEIALNLAIERPAEHILCELDSSVPAS